MSRHPEQSDSPTGPENPRGPPGRTGPGARRDARRQPAGRAAAGDERAARGRLRPPANAEPPDGEIHARTQTEQANEELQEENAESALDQPSDGSGGE